MSSLHTSMYPTMRFFLGGLGAKWNEFQPVLDRWKQLRCCLFPFNQSRLPVSPQYSSFTFSESIPVVRAVPLGSFTPPQFHQRSRPRTQVDGRIPGVIGNYRNSLSITEDDGDVTAHGWLVVFLLTWRTAPTSEVKSDLKLDFNETNKS